MFSADKKRMSEKQKVNVRFTIFFWLIKHPLMPRYVYDEYLLITFISLRSSARTLMATGMTAGMFLAGIAGGCKTGVVVGVESLQSSSSEVKS